MNEPKLAYHMYCIPYILHRTCKLMNELKLAYHMNCIPYILHRTCNQYCTELVTLRMNHDYHTNWPEPIVSLNWYHIKSNPITICTSYRSLQELSRWNQAHIYANQQYPLPLASRYLGAQHIETKKYIYTRHLHHSYLHATAWNTTSLLAQILVTYTQTPKIQWTSLLTDPIYSPSPPHPYPNPMR